MAIKKILVFLIIILISTAITSTAFAQTQNQKWNKITQDKFQKIKGFSVTLPKEWLSQDSADGIKMKPQSFKSKTFAPSLVIRKTTIDYDLSSPEKVLQSLIDANKKHLGDIISKDIIPIDGGYKITLSSQTYQQDSKTGQNVPIKHQRLWYLLYDGNQIGVDFGATDEDYLGLLPTIQAMTNSFDISTTINVPETNPCKNPTIKGDGKSNFLKGTEGDDIIDGGDGDDVIVGLGGKDVICGGLGNDKIDGGTDSDEIYGQDGDDVLYGVVGSTSSNSMTGGSTPTPRGSTSTTTSYSQISNLQTFFDSFFLFDQNQVIPSASAAILSCRNLPTSYAYTSGNDRIYGGTGNDLICGGYGNDTINGNAGNDSLYGGAGNDLMSGDNGNDLVMGEDGNDTLNGNVNNDVVRGGFGSDVLDGGLGSDTLDGGPNKDTCRNGETVSYCE